MANYRTSDAARYLTEVRGVATSKSLLEKLRLRGAEDERGNGPDFHRDQNGHCWYAEADLNAYAEACLAKLRFRAPAARPLNFARREADRAA